MIRLIFNAYVFATVRKQDDDSGNPVQIHGGTLPARKTSFGMHCRDAKGV